MGEKNRLHDRLPCPLDENFWIICRINPQLSILFRLDRYGVNYGIIT